MDSRPTVAVLGAGWSGLSAAVRLVEGGCRVILLEKRAVPGGRALSYTDNDSGDALDNGPHIFLGCYSGTIRFLDAIGAGARLRFSRRLRLAFIDRERGAFQFRCPSLPSPWNLLAGLLGLRGLDLPDRFRALRLGARARRLTESDLQRLESSTLEIWLAKAGQTPAIRRVIWDPIAMAALNEDPAIASAAVFARVFREAFLSGGPSGIGLSAFGLSDLYAGPALRFLEKNGCEVRFRSGVSRILIGPGGVEGLQLGDGTRIVADAYLSTLPPRDLQAALPRTTFHSDPYFRRIASLETSPVVSIHLWYDRKFLEEPFVGLLGTRTQWLFDRRAILGSEGEGSGLSAVISAARSYIDWPASDIIAMAEEDIAACVPAARRARLLRAKVVKERHATFSPRAGSSRLRPGPRTPIPNLILGGDWTDTGLPGCIEGAVRSGERAAAEVGRFVLEDRTVE